MLRLTTENIIACTAMLITTAGSVFATSYHWGQINQQVETLQNRTAVVESHIAKHDDQLTEIKQQNSAMAQSLDDIKDTVHDIQTQVRKPRDHNE